MVKYKVVIQVIIFRTKRFYNATTMVIISCLTYLVLTLIYYRGINIQQPVGNLYFSYLRAR